MKGPKITNSGKMAITVCSIEAWSTTGYVLSACAGLMKLNAVGSVTCEIQTMKRPKPTTSGKVEELERVEE
jgi:hypothetical protein